jgi:hypothetical protein
MRTGVALVCSAVAGFWVAAPLALAHQKPVKACQAEWQTNKAIYQPEGITEKEYVDECRDFAAAPPATPAAQSAPRQATHAAATAPTLATKQTQTSTLRIRATARTEPGDARGAAKIDRLE